uniref:Uncharacterized protein n=1 Tax=Meloidogyne enterolobii TaxID=390850 RepID=A0A6V7V6Y6_MELEN|nr:unnamed protein product [Meloidogyne enterolobii]
MLKNGEGCNRIFLVNAENSFNKPKNNFNYFLHYFEVKCKFEGELENKDGRRLAIGLKNLIKNRDIFYCANESTIFIERSDSVELETYFNNNDIFGCGLLYPPINKLNEFTYIFFTQNGKQIGKAILLKNKFYSFQPNVDLECCSIETNFGNDLKTKPFKYDIFEPLVIKEFY